MVVSHFHHRKILTSSFLVMSNAELATGYAALILADEGLEITADKLTTLTKAAGVEVESIWTQLFAKALEGKDVKDLLLNVGGSLISLGVFNCRLCWCRTRCFRRCCCCCHGWCCRGSSQGREGRGEGRVRRGCTFHYLKVTNF